MIISSGLPYPLGVTAGAGGSNVAVRSEIADVIEVCLFDDAGQETRVPLPERNGHVFHGFLHDIGPGQRYGLRVTGPYDPARGLRCDPSKLLLDPYATAVEGEISWGSSAFEHGQDSAAAMPRCVITDREFDWGDDVAPHVPLSETVVYETHVKGISARHPDVLEEARGTYAGLSHPAVIQHLVDLGVTSVELMPVHQFAQDGHLLDKGLSNYWGYNTLAFFAPHGAYSSTGDGGGQVWEFKQMVKSLHAAGLEVILDVVYNHTAEGNDRGPTLSLKGIDNPSYYRLVEGDEQHYFDTTGTGNSVNVGHPAALRLIMDSLRYWVQEMHVDGFRFDLATTLTRQTGDTSVHSAFLALCEQDPVLAAVKLIAEPWDTAGYQVGEFPARWSEWNGKYRDDIRDFWRGQGALSDFGLRLTGSADLYHSGRRTPTASVNFVTAHDGFTLVDLTSYDEKHNEANGEDNQDGESHNSSWNCGVEGPTDDPAVLALRARQRRNLLGTLLLSAGVPMLLGGDELGRSQQGNNNAYCQDSEISWYDWENVDKDLLEFTKEALRLRRENPALRPREYLRGPGGEPAQLVLYRPDGQPMTSEDWGFTGAKALAVAVDGRQIEDAVGETSDDRFLLLVNAHHEPIAFTLPGGRGAWSVVLTSDDQEHVRPIPVGTALEVRDRSLVLLHR